MQPEMKKDFEQLKVNFNIMPKKFGVWIFFFCIYVGLVIAAIKVAH